MNILVTGGAGYIGTHTLVELLDRGHDVVVVDNYVNSHPESLDRVREITGKTFPFYEANVCDEAALDRIFDENKVDCVIHFAGLKAVGESCAKPLMYYRNNLDGMLSLISSMRKHDVKRIVFSSSATVYRSDAGMPVDEESPLGCINPYGWTKFMGEEILRDVAKAEPDWSVVLLRYFNPIGAHESGKIGEDPNGVPNNLMPYITQTALGRLKELHVFGNDYPTPDGTGVRDYIHVVDLARGHVAALKKLAQNCGLFTCNLGTGNGYSVLDVLHAYEKACGKTLPYVIDPRRPGDIAECYADPEKARVELGWEAQYGIEEMCESSWKWQSANPNGYNA
ncbi:MAG TPA: UDP-glucose 4-epimerase GalE [Candidatus Scatomorpha merdigallinarum]|nr:UDP-glucose 4-epimerase GalE [Candidatus Scatomorpha merdigallinarum]